MLSRRSFFRFPAFLSLGLPAFLSSLPGEASPVRCVSVDREDVEGYRNYCLLRGDGCQVDVYLDGVKQKYACMADVDRGCVHRAVETPDGNMAHDGNEILTETVYGRVDIRVERPE